MNTPLDERTDQAIGALPAALQPAAGLWLGRLLDEEGHELLECCRATSMIERLLQLVAVSDFAGHVLLRHRQWFVDVIQSGRILDPPENDASECEPGLADAPFMKWLRDERNRSLVRILWRDLHGAAGVPETLRSLSTLADRLIVASAAHARRQLAERCGELRGDDGDPVPLVILAMGKLGGVELNFSSDIDLIFLYTREGSSDGARVLRAEEYCARLTRRIVALLEEVTADGFGYRVDTRLRPFGDSGPPVVSFAALESYLINHGRSWERYAWLKARIVWPKEDSGDLAGLRTELIEPFVYRRYLDYGVFESLRDMKAMIAAEVRRREMARNIKLGPGGIREIEFIVQSLQLVRGGRVRRLQSTGLRHALHQLMAGRGLERAAAAELDNAYCFLRRLENVLQAMRDQQTHELPSDANERARVALGMGYADWESLSKDIERHRDFVSGQFAKIAFREEGVAANDASELTRALSACCDTEATADRWRQVLEDFDYPDASGLAAEVHAFLDARATRQIDATASKRLHALLPNLLSQLQKREHATVVLKRLLGIVAEVLRRSAYVALLNENAAVLSRLIDLCERSAYLAEEIARFPLLLDEMLDPRLYSARLDAQLLRDDLRERLAGLQSDDSERQVEALAQFQRATLFRIAAADFSDQLPVMKVSDRLTDLAEMVLDQALEIAWRDLVQKFGEPVYTESDQARIAGLGVIAYGKLGGIELSYRSDLDLVFLHNSRGTDQQTRGPKSIDNNLFFVRLARRLVHFLTVQTGSGALYEVDTRLRPSGHSGLLVTNIEAFERYQTENAWTWEHQALLRARPVAGSARVAREFGRIRAQTLKERVNRETLCGDVGSMREKMRAQLDHSTAEQFDLKQGAGGIGDIEFLVQYFVLQHAMQHVAVMHYSDNIRQLGTLGAAGCIDAGDAIRLQDAYRKYRTRVHRLLLDERPALARPDEFSRERAFVRDVWQRTIG